MFLILNGRHVISLGGLGTIEKFSEVKAGVDMKAVFWLGIIIMVLSQISRLYFKQSNISLSSHMSTFWAELASRHEQDR